jgi:hypothetical protein
MTGEGNMAIRFISTASTVAMALALISLIVAPVAGQATNTRSKSDLPRTPNGHPDLQGIYDLATMTPLERWPGDPPFLTREQAEALQRAELDRRAASDPPDRPRPPPVGRDPSAPKSFFELLEKNAAGSTGGYNYVWLNQDTAYTVVNGQIRTSIIVDPPDGHVPPFNEAARQRLATARATPTSTAAERQALEGANPPPGAFDNPEQRPLSERCLLGFGSTSGPPALPDYFYNDLHQIVQTADSIMILSEMIHDVRIVRMNAPHLTKNIRRWMGDSVGHWEGDTLVVDTTNFNDKTRFRGSTENLHVIERFTRANDKTLLYSFTIEDPDTWDRPWTGEYAWPATDKPIYEYACHEGNYALGGILRGARRQEAEQAAAQTKN